MRSSHDTGKDDAKWGILVTKKGYFSHQKGVFWSPKRGILVTKKGYFAITFIYSNDDLGRAGLFTMSINYKKKE